MCSSAACSTQTASFNHHRSTQPTENTSKAPALSVALFLFLRFTSKLLWLESSRISLIAGGKTILTRRGPPYSNTAWLHLPTAPHFRQGGCSHSASPDSYRHCQVIDTQAIHSLEASLVLQTRVSCSLILLLGLFQSHKDYLKNHNLPKKLLQITKITDFM